MKTIKSILKKMAYYSGFLNYKYHSKNKTSLTVVLFHRVLPVDDDRWSFADMDWTVSDIFFRECLAFFVQHYNVISLQDIEQAQIDGLCLPDHSLLITFDDGWSDNLEFAQQILSDFGLKSLLFVTTGAIGQPILSWQEAFYSAWRADKLNQPWVDKINKINLTDFDIPITEKDIRKLINLLQRVPLKLKDRMMELAFQLTEDFLVGKQMMNKDQLRQLEGEQFEFGTHGTRHEPYTQVDDVIGSMKLAKKQLSEISNVKNAKSMSFPHGMCNPQLINSAKEAGYSMIFTGHTFLNNSVNHSSYVYGRFNIEQGDLQNKNGQLLPEQLALYLFRQPIRDVTNIATSQ